MRCFLCREAIKKGEGRTEPPLNVHAICYDEAFEKLIESLKEIPKDGVLKVVVPPADRLRIPEEAP